MVRPLRSAVCAGALYDIFADAKANLAVYKVPAQLKIVRQTPRNGKLDRKSLLAMMSDG